MRLVDADNIALYLIVEGQNHPDKYGFSLGDTIKFSPSEVKKIIQKMPTIEERKKGEWINVTNDESLEEEYECSVCGYELFYSNPTKFCPGCGADMRGEIR